MYIANQKSGYNKRDGDQWATGTFLVLCDNKDDPKTTEDGSWMRAFVLKNVRMWQSGAWMVAVVLVGDEQEEVILSGSYGSNGLSRSVSKDLFDKATPIPKELYDAWCKGEGWNSAGSEAPSMREWALSENGPVRLKSKKRPPIKQVES